MPVEQLSQRDFYTTGEMARALTCAQQTVIRRIDAGTMPGYRLPGRGGQRRCRKAEFREYLAEHGVPVSRLDAVESGVVLAEKFTTPRDRHG